MRSVAILGTEKHTSNTHGSTALQSVSGPHSNGPFRSCAAALWLSICRGHEGLAPVSKTCKSSLSSSWLLAANLCDIHHFLGWISHSKTKRWVGVESKKTRIDLLGLPTGQKHKQRAQKTYFIRIDNCIKICCFQSILSLLYNRILPSNGP